MRFKKYALTIIAAGVVLSGCAGASGDTASGSYTEDSKDQNNVISDMEQEIPVKIEDTLKTDHGNILVYVDADVHPIESELPVLRVTPHEITAEDVQQWAEVLFEGNTAYKGEPPLTKAQIDEQITSLQDSIANGSLAEEYGADTEEYQEMVAYYKEMIGQFEKLAVDAPDAEENNETDWNFYPDAIEEDPELSKTYVLNVKTKLNGYTPRIIASNRNATDYKLHRLVFFYDEEPYLDELFGEDHSEKEALKLAEQTIGQLGIGEWDLTCQMDNSMNNNAIYTFTYAPKYNHVPAAEAGIDMINIKSEDPYAANLYYTSLEISVWNGIVESVELTSPMDVKEEVDSNVETLSFEEIYASFQKYVKDDLYERFREQYGRDGSSTIKLDSIDEKLFRIKEKNSDDFLIVPAWIFSETDRNGTGMKKHWAVINAIDGSVIDEWNGY